MLTGSSEIVALTLNERVKAKLESDFGQGFCIEVVEYDRLFLPDRPEWFTHSTVIEAGFINLTEDGKIIEARLYESRHQSSSLPEATEVHDLTFSLQSPIGEESDYILVDKPCGNIQVQGVKMTAPPISVCGLQLRPRLNRKDMGEFFEEYLGSSVDPEATQHRFEERREYHRGEVRGNAELYPEGFRQAIALHRGESFQIWPEE